jgi:hypothetical protein
MPARDNDMGCDIHGLSQIRYGDSEWFDCDTIEDGRNYRLFAALAGVRNGFGFAGIATHEPIIPIAEPRGLPEDFVNDEDEHCMGDHSFSWLHMSEIVSWPGWGMCLSDAPETPLRERCQAFWKWVEWQQVRHGKNSDIRIVFGFDS